MARTNTQRRRRPNDRCRRQGITPLEDNIILRSVVPLPTGSSGIHRNTEFVSTTTYAECAGRQREAIWDEEEELHKSPIEGGPDGRGQKCYRNDRAAVAPPRGELAVAPPVGSSRSPNYTNHKVMNRFRNSTDGRMCFWGGP